MSSPRQIAKANGDRFYHSQPCKRCGETKRYTVSKVCVSCEEKYRKENREAISVREAEYYKENREAISVRKAKYRKENREAISVREAEYRKENREALRAKAAKYRKENREALLAKQNARQVHIRALLEKARTEGPFEIESNDPREIAAARGQLKYFANRECPKHPGVFERYTAGNDCPICKNVRTAKRKSLHREALIPLTPVEKKAIDALYAEARRLSEETGQDYHVDHILPLSKGGVHHPINLRVLPGTENASKHATSIWEEITPEIALLHVIYQTPKLEPETLHNLQQVIITGTY